MALGYAQRENERRFSGDYSGSSNQPKGNSGGAIPRVDTDTCCKPNR